MEQFNSKIIILPSFTHPNDLDYFLLWKIVQIKPVLFQPDHTKSFNL